MALAGQPETSKDKKTVIIFLIGLLVVGVIIVTLFQTGPTGLMDLIKRVFKYLLILGLLGLVLYIVLWFFKKPKEDLVENNKKDIIEAGMLSKPPMLKDIYFTGDKEHGEFRLGKIVGYCQLMSYKDLDILAGLTAEQIELMEQKGEVPSDYIIYEDCFIFKTLPFPFSIFEQPKVLRTLENEHSQLIGNVKVYAVSAISKYGFVWPNRAHLDIARIDIAVIREAWRGGIHQFLKDFVSITQNAVGLDAEYKKSLDQRKLLKIPTQMSQEESHR